MAEAIRTTLEDTRSKLEAASRGEVIAHVVYPTVQIYGDERTFIFTEPGEEIPEELRGLESYGGALSDEQAGKAALQVRAEIKRTA